MNITSYNKIKIRFFFFLYALLNYVFITILYVFKRKSLVKVHKIVTHIFFIITAEITADCLKQCIIKENFA